jgi:hypothetical protein
LFGGDGKPRGLRRRPGCLGKKAVWRFYYQFQIKPKPLRGRDGKPRVF